LPRRWGGRGAAPGPRGGAPPALVAARAHPVALLPEGVLVAAGEPLAARPAARRGGPARRRPRLCRRRVRSAALLPHRSGLCNCCGSTHSVHRSTEPPRPPQRGRRCLHRGGLDRRIWAMDAPGQAWGAQWLTEGRSVSRLTGACKSMHFSDERGGCWERRRRSSTVFSKLSRADHYILYASYFYPALMSSDEDDFKHRIGGARPSVGRKHAASPAQFSLRSSKQLDPCSLGGLIPAVLRPLPHNVLPEGRAQLRALFSGRQHDGSAGGAAPAAGGQCEWQSNGRGVGHRLC